MTWDEHYLLWSQVRNKPGGGDFLQIQAARNRIGENTQEDWNWFIEALEDQDRKWFVATIFKSSPVPKRLLKSLLRAGVLERNPSNNRYFIEPCVRSLGGKRVLTELLGYLITGTDAEKAGAASALYWSGDNPRNEDLTEIYEFLRNRLLQEFVDNPNTDVRRRIIPRLNFELKDYPPEIQPLVPIAIEIARSNTDEYIRHRVEIQLGSGGPFMAIPDTST